MAKRSVNQFTGRARCRTCGHDRDVKVVLPKVGAMHAENPACPFCSSEEHDILFLDGLPHKKDATNVAVTIRASEKEMSKNAEQAVKAAAKARAEQLRAEAAALEASL